MFRLCLKTCWKWYLGCPKLVKSWDWYLGRGLPQLFKADSDTWAFPYWSKLRVVPGSRVFPYWSKLKVVPGLWVFPYTSKLRLLPGIWVFPYWSKLRVVPGPFPSGQSWEWYLCIQDLSPSVKYERLGAIWTSVFRHRFNLRVVPGSDHSPRVKNGIGGAITNQVLQMLHQELWMNQQV